MTAFQKLLYSLLVCHHFSLLPAFSCPTSYLRHVTHGTTQFPLPSEVHHISSISDSYYSIPQLFSEALNQKALVLALVGFLEQAI